MKIQKLLLLKAFCYDNLKNDFKVTFLPITGIAIVEDANGDILFLVAKEDNIVECCEGYCLKPFRTVQLVETFQNSFKYGWKDI